MAQTPTYVVGAYGNYGGWTVVTLAAALRPHLTTLAARALGSLGGRAGTEAQHEARRANGQEG
ncbi:MAG: hypothetical protein HY814_14315 [Candidatus Riflebacteria bacterium]|nr:hypothetical protein [Candidatus Riflebacteria bacterium]